MKNSYLCLTAILMTSFGLLAQSSENTIIGNAGSDMCCAEPSYCSQCPSEKNFNGPSGVMNCAYNIPCSPNLCDGWDFYLGAEFIYWQASQDGLEYGITIPGYTTYPVGDLVGSEVLDLDFAFKPGFRVELGWHTNMDDWSLGAIYTYMHGELSNSTTAETGSIQPYWVRSDNSPLASLVSSKWKNKLDLLDVTLSRNYFVGTHLTLAPKYGLRTYWIRQSVSNFALTDTPGAPDLYTDAKSRSWGIGPVAGVDANWFFCKGFRIYTDVSAALVYSRYKVSLVQDGDLSIPIVPRFIDTDRVIYELQPCLGTGLGIGWGDYFCGEQFFFDLSLGYEFNMFFNQNMSRKLADLVMWFVSPAAGNLFYQGLVVKSQFNF